MKRRVQNYLCDNKMILDKQQDMKRLTWVQQFLWTHSNQASEENWNILVNYVLRFESRMVENNGKVLDIVSCETFFNDFLLLYMLQCTWQGTKGSNLLLTFCPIFEYLKTSRRSSTPGKAVVVTQVAERRHSVRASRVWFPGWIWLWGGMLSIYSHRASG